MRITSDWPWWADFIFLSGVVVWLLFGTYVRWQATKLETMKFRVYAAKALGEVMGKDD